jgi:hypothetical protein
MTRNGERDRLDTNRTPVDDQLLQDGEFHA